jgi:spermidine/putrescine transport system ATP-binding protein
VMNRGDLLQVGNPREVYEAPATRFVADFIGDNNYIPGVVASFEGGIAEVVATPDCRMRALGAPGLRVGRPATVAFRPEKVRIVSAPPAEDHNSLLCDVIDVVYTGSFTTHVLRCGSGAEIFVRSQNRTAAPTRVGAVGGKVTIAWPIGLGKAFPDEEILPSPKEKAPAQ